jgi:hypothetical protein
MKYLVLVFLISGSVHAQVNLCADAKGRKTYTEAECSELGMTPVGVIKDIKTTSKRCDDLTQQITDQQNTVKKLRASENAFKTNEVGAVLIENQITQTERQYKKECKR